MYSANYNNQRLVLIGSWLNILHNYTVQYIIIMSKEISKMENGAVMQGYFQY